MAPFLPDADSPEVYRTSQDPKITVLTKSVDDMKSTATIKRELPATSSDYWDTDERDAFDGEPPAIHPLIIEALRYTEKRAPLFTDEELEMLSHRTTLSDGKDKVRIKTKDLCEAIRLDPCVWDEVEECIRVARLEDQIKKNNPSDHEYRSARLTYDRAMKTYTDGSVVGQSPVAAKMAEIASNWWEKVQRLRQEHDDYFGVATGAL